VQQHYGRCQVTLPAVNVHSTVSPASLQRTLTSSIRRCDRPARQPDERNVTARSDVPKLLRGSPARMRCCRPGRRIVWDMHEVRNINMRTRSFIDTPSRARVRLPISSSEVPEKNYVEINTRLFTARNELLALMDECGPGSAEHARLEEQLKDVTYQIVQANYGLVKKYVSKFTSHTSAADCDDFEGAGIVGLIKAIKSYDMSRGPFAQWAFRPIKREVLRSVQTTDHPNLNPGDFERRPDILRARERLTAAGVDNSDSAVAIEAGSTVTQVARVLQAPQLMSLTAPISSADGDETAESVIPDDAPEPLTQVMAKMSIRALEQYGLSALTERERFVLIRRFGIDGEPPQRLSTIGAQLRLSREAARQIEAKALAKLTHPNVLRRLVRTHDNV
jgi:RNA polymerase sigma factor (sigma-70 family)